MTLAFFDTNVLLYMFASDQGRKQEQASRLYERHALATRVVLSVQVLNEFYAAATRKAGLQMTASYAAQTVEGFARNNIVSLDAGLTLAAVRRSERNRLNFWDALIVEAALFGEAEVLYTEDLNHGQMIDGLRIENPFRELNPIRTSELR